MKRNIINFLAFYAGWFICVKTASWVAPVAALALIAIQIPRRHEWAVIGAAFLLGTSTDTFLEQAGLVSYAGGPRIGPLVPLWIASLWALFASTLNRSMAWLKDKPVAATIAGAVSGPMTYWLAMKLGAVEMTTAGYIAVAIEFAVFTPLLLRLPVQVFVRRLAS
ncbi:MAG: DUF2878 domain-containing protein [Planctomycetota bacterium]